MKLKNVNRVLSAVLALILLLGLLPVSTAAANRKAWSKVAAPVITAVKDNGDGSLSVKVDAVVGDDGADEVAVGMYGEDGKLIVERKTPMQNSSHSFKFTPTDSGTYTFKALMRREGEKDKQAEKTAQIAFVFPLQAPVIISGTSRGEGKIALEWTAVHEAVSYELLCDGKTVGTTDQTAFTVEGLTVGSKYSFRVVAIRGADRNSSKEMTVTASKDAKVTWGFTYYGTSTRDGDNGYTGDLNETGSVTVFSENGRGKIVPKSTDGLAFYYTPIPTEYNFTLRAKVSVDSWTHSNGQEGFGLLVADRLGVNGDSGAFWTNQIMAVATKIEYRYDVENETVVTSGGSKYTMKMGIGTIGKTGITKDNLALFEENDTDTINKCYLSETYPLDTSAGYAGEDSSREYNIIGNRTNPADASGIPQNLERMMVTDFILEIQKNNTGYFVSYYDAEGNFIARHKYYGADALSQLDEEYVYAGFFASRNARATFSDVSLTTILATEDAPAEEKPVTYINPGVSISSGSVTTSKDYELILDFNVAGTIKLQVNGQTLLEQQPVAMEERFTKWLQMGSYGENDIRVEFTPDPNQDLGPDTKLSTTDTVFTNMTVMYNRGNYHRKTIYVSPDGKSNGAGTQQYPYDIYTAVNNVVPGQTILLMEGTYKLSDTVRIQRGMDGTAEKPIRMMADPAAKSRPVLDFQGICAGIVHGGDYWYFAGFDVTNSAAAQKGFQVSGDHNVLDRIDAYRNGNSGIQISRYSGTDRTVDQWPSYNLILNCNAYLNVDPGEQDADGFACKLTSGVGNVFDGCVAYNNADDGWDLYAKVETGPIGSVVIRNCVAYNNGYRENGEPGLGNGNGFKMGGESLSGYHKLENSVAFNNKEKGIDSNSCPDIIVENCVSYNNGSYNVALYTNNAADTDFAANGVISFKDDKCASVGQGDNLKPKGDQDESKIDNDSNYYWNGTACANGAGKKLTAEIFVSLEFKGFTRKADGSLDMQGFLALTDKAPAGAGANMDIGTPSRDMTTLDADEAHRFSDVWTYDESDYRQYHWHECECGDRADMAEHSFQWITDKEATETELGRKHEECSVCHYKKPAIDVYPDAPQPTNPTVPTQPSAGTPSTQPTVPTASQPGGSGDDGQGSPAVIIVIVVVVVAAAVAVLLLLKKKK